MNDVALLQRRRHRQRNIVAGVHNVAHCAPLAVDENPLGMRLAAFHEPFGNIHAAGDDIAEQAAVVCDCREIMDPFHSRTSKCAWLPPEPLSTTRCAGMRSLSSAT